MLYPAVCISDIINTSKTRPACQWQKYQMRHKPNLFCSSLVKGQPTWLPREGSNWKQNIFGMIMDTRWKYLYNFQRFSCQFAFSVRVSFNVAVNFRCYMPMFICQNGSASTRHQNNKTAQPRAGILHLSFRRLNSL